LNVRMWLPTVSAGPDYLIHYP